RNPGEICEWLDDVTQAVQTEQPTLRVFPFSRELKGSFNTGVKNGPVRLASFHQRVSGIRIRQKKIWNQWIITRRENRLTQIACLAVIGLPKTSPGNNREPPQIGVWIKKLMKGVDSRRTVIFKAGAGCEIPMQ